MPLIRVSVAEGRSEEKIRSLISDLTKVMCEWDDIPPAAVSVIVEEVERTRWAHGDVTLAERNR